jgi:ornithine cyclodeaminase
MEGASLTALRTGAASGLATDLLARPEAASVALIGGGTQARAHLEAMCCVRPIRQVRVYDRDARSAVRLAEELRKPGLEVESVASPAAALRSADIVCTTTTAKSPVFEDADVQPGTHINAIGVFQPDRAEVPAATVRRARVVVDHRASALEEAGDLLLPLRAGLIGEDHIAAELGPLLLGQVEGRTSAGQVTLFKSVGVAVQDLYAAARALDAARRMGIGTPLPR